MRLKCPHCTAPAKIRTSRDMSEISRESHLQCTNVECAHTWVVLSSAVRTIAPSMMPNPRVFIPQSQRPHAQPEKIGEQQPPRYGSG